MSKSECYGNVDRNNGKMLILMDIARKVMKRTIITVILLFFIYIFCQFFLSYNGILIHLLYRC